MQVGDEQSVKTLVALGANVNQCDELGRTPLDYAHRYIENPSGKDVQMKHLDRGATVLMKGSKSGFLETTELTASHAQSLEDYVKPKPKSALLQILEDVGAVPGREIHRCEHPSRHPVEKHGKINTAFFKNIEDKLKCMLRSDSTPNPKEAIEIVKTLREQEDYRRACGSRILCLDGGGIRGLVQMCILQEIENRTGKSVTELFDWIVGTSTGGVIALTLVYGRTLTGVPVHSPYVLVLTACSLMKVPFSHVCFMVST